MMLLYQAIGDAYGAGFEYANDMLPFNTLDGYVQNSSHTSLEPGKYTDDTQMAIGIAELMISGKEWTLLNLANKFVEVFKRDEREGYSRHFQKFLGEVQSGEEFLNRITNNNNNSDKSGGAMRATPIGMYRDVELVKELSALQASLTHNTPDGIGAAVASSLLAHYFIYNLGPKKDVGVFLNDHVKTQNWNADWNQPVLSPGWHSVTAAVTAIKTSETLSEVLRKCVAFSGDVDTVAAIALSAGCMSGELERDIPKHLFDNLENGLFGRDFLIMLSSDLYMLKT